MDFRGNGRSDRPAAGYDFDTLYGDLSAVLETAARPPFALVGYSCSNMLLLRYAAEHPERVSHLVMLSPQYSQPMPEPFDEKFAPLVRDDFGGYLRRFFTQPVPRAPLAEGHRGRHRLGQRDHARRPGRGAPPDPTRTTCATSWAKITAPTLVLHGTRDTHRALQRRPGDRGGDPGRPLRDLRGRRAWPARPGGGQGEPPDPRLRPRPPGRVGDHPGHDRAADGEAAGANRPRAAILFLSSPIGLGHIQRDLAIAKALRRAVTPMRPSTSWPPIRPIAWSVTWASACIPPPGCSSTRARTSRAGPRDHELHAFNALWDMDEIMAANFMVFADVVEAEDYDLWIGDEGWDLDYFLHENPNLKRAPYVLRHRLHRRAAHAGRSLGPRSSGGRGRRTPRTSTTSACTPTCAICRSWSATRRTCSTASSAPTCPTCGSGRASTSASPATRTTSTPRPIADVRPCGVALGYRDGERTILVSVGRHPGRTPPARQVRRSVRRASPHGCPTRAWCWWPVRGSIPASCRRDPQIEVRPFVPRSLPRTTRRSIWPSCRAASPPRWSWRPSRPRSSTSRCAITSSSSTSRGPPPGAAGRRGADGLRPNHCRGPGRRDGRPPRAAGALR